MSLISSKLSNGFHLLLKVFTKAFKALCKVALATLLIYLSQLCLLTPLTVAALLEHIGFAPAAGICSCCSPCWEGFPSSSPPYTHILTPSSPTGIYSNVTFFFFFFSFIFISWRLITLQYCSGFCHTLT